MKTVIIQNWEESERGWGVRPDGFTIHYDMLQRDAYVAWYNKTFNNEASAPDEYTRVSGDPIEIEVSDELYKTIKKASLNKVKDRVKDCVHGKGRYFDFNTDASPQRILKLEDLEL